MSILVDQNSRVLVQGITGWQARRHVEYMVRYGTRVVAGVSPGKEGEQVNTIPVFDTVARASAACGPFDATVIFVPAHAAADAALEAVAAALPLIVVLAEGLPFKDSIAMVHAARSAGATLIGPNAQGLISPGKAKLGGTGGDNPSRLFRPGPVGVVSRSGGMGQETSWLLSRAGIGQSTYVAIGGELINGCGFVEIVQRFEQDPETQAIVCFGEPGTEREEELATLLAAGDISKPVIAYVPGSFIESRGSGLSFGHAGAVIDGRRGAPSSKRRLLAEAGATIAEQWSAIPALVQAALQKRSVHNLHVE